LRQALRLVDQSAVGDLLDSEPPSGPPPTALRPFDPRLMRAFVGSESKPEPGGRSSCSVLLAWIGGFTVLVFLGLLFYVVSVW